MAVRKNSIQHSAISSQQERSPQHSAISSQPIQNQTQDQPQTPPNQPQFPPFVSFVVKPRRAL